MEEINQKHLDIINKYIVDCHKIYSQRPKIKFCDPFKLSFDQYFLSISDDTWLQLENQPNISKQINKKISQMLINVCLTPILSKVTVNDDNLICVGKTKQYYVKYQFSDLTPGVKKDIIAKKKKCPPNVRFYLGLILPINQSESLPEVSIISGDDFIRDITSYKTPLKSLLELLRNQLSYCTSQKILSPLSIQILNQPNFMMNTNSNS